MGEASESEEESESVQEQLDNVLTVAVESASKIEKAKQESETTARELRELVGRIKQLMEEAEGLQKTVKVDSVSFSNLKSQADTLLTDISTTKGRVEAESQSIGKLLTAATSNEEAVSKLSIRATSIEQTLSVHEAELKKGAEKQKELLETIESLLPGATSAGLASAFREKHEELSKSRLFWSGLFIVSVGCLLVHGFYYPPSIDPATLDWSHLATSLINRIPVIVPLVWLAIYAHRRHSQVASLQEDYSHKEALSKSFEGFKREFESLADTEMAAEGTKALQTLCNNVLQALESHPHKIYGTGPEFITPLSIFKEISGTLAEIASKLKPS